MKHYEAAELVELGNATELVLGGKGDPLDNIAGDDERFVAFDDDAD